MVWALHDSEWNAYLGWPYLAQVCRVERRRATVRGGRPIKAEVEVTYALTSLARAGRRRDPAVGAAATGGSRTGPTGCAT